MVYKPFVKKWAGLYALVSLCQFQLLFMNFSYGVLISNNPFPARIEIKILCSLLSLASHPSCSFSQNTAVSHSNMASKTAVVSSLVYNHVESDKCYSYFYANFGLSLWMFKNTYWEQSTEKNISTWGRGNHSLPFWCYYSIQYILYPWK